MLDPARLVFIVRAMPESWLWPERMTASILGMDEETAGVRLIKAASPERWRDIVAGYQILSDNRDAIAQCARNEAKRPAKFAAPLRSEAQIRCKAFLLHDVVRLDAGLFGRDQKGGSLERNVFASSGELNPGVSASIELCPLE